MKRGLRLLLLLGALALCVGGYFLAGKLVPDETPDDETDAAAAIEVPSLDSGALARIDFTRGGETVALKKSGGDWLYEADPSCPLDQTLVRQMVSVSTSLSASRSFESQNLAEYGLDRPACSIALTDASGGKKSLALGDLNETTKEYYLTADGGGTIYLVDSALHDAFDKGLLDLVQKETVPNMDSATRLSIERPDGTLTLSLVKTAGDESAGNTGSDSDDAAKTSSIWYMEQPGAAPATLDTDKAAELLSELTQLVFRKCASYNAADIDLAQYGLDAPAATVTVEYPAVVTGTAADGSAAQAGGAAAAFTLALGDVFGEDYRYARLAGSGMVYLIDESTAQKLLSASWDTLRPNA